MSLLKDSKIKGRLLWNEPLSRHTTLRIGGPVKIWAEPEDLDDLTAILEIARAEGVAVVVIGSGSNLLVSDNGALNMIGVCLKGLFDSFEIGDKRTAAGAGCSLQRFILSALKSGYSGLEFMAGIPGTVGGAIKMNAGSGAKGPWIGDFIETLKVLRPDGRIKMLKRKELKFGYRQSGLGDSIILEAEFNLRRAQDIQGLLNEYERFLAEKRSKQELSRPSAGCVFKNPKDPGLSAGRLIEGCALKARRVGEAQISERHANFIINLGAATFKDVTGLIGLIQSEVFKKYNIRLDTEIEILK